MSNITFIKLLISYRENFIFFFICIIVSILSHLFLMLMDFKIYVEIYDSSPKHWAAKFKNIFDR